MLPQSHFVRSLRAEFLKLKNTPILWLALAGGICLAGFIFLIYCFNVEKFTANPASPWIIYFDLSFMLTAMLVVVPYVILLTSAMVYPEHDMNTWKYIYTLPLKKYHFYYAKLLTVLILLGFTFSIFFVSLILGAYLLDLIFPAYQFGDNPADIQDFGARLGHAYISSLGITAIHYWFSVRWKSFILPVGIGLVGFIIAIFLIFFGQRYDLAAFLPHAYPILAGAEFGTESIGLDRVGWFLPVEFYSLACFVVFSILGFYEENRRNV